MAELDQIREVLRNRIKKYNRDELKRMLKQLTQEKKRRARKKTSKK